MLKAKRKQITFPDSGKTAYIPAVSMNGIALKVTRKHPRPAPPVQLVDFGDGVKRRETNYADPDYHEQIRGWNNFLEAEVQNIALGRVATMTLNDEQKAEVAAWKAENPGQWDEGDSEAALWLEEIAITTQNDFRALITLLSGVDEEVVDAVGASFPGNI